MPIFFRWRPLTALGRAPPLEFCLDPAGIPSPWRGEMVRSHGAKRAYSHSLLTRWGLNGQR